MWLQNRRCQQLCSLSSTKKSYLAALERTPVLKKKQGVSNGVKEFLLAKVQAICSLVSYFKIFHLATKANFKTCGQHLRIQPAKLDIRIFYGKRVWLNLDFSMDIFFLWYKLKTSRKHYLACLWIMWYPRTRSEKKKRLIWPPTEVNTMSNCHCLLLQTPFVPAFMDVTLQNDGKNNTVRNYRV